MLKFGDPVSIQKRDQASLKAEFAATFPDRRIDELIDRLDDCELFRIEDGCTQLTRRNREHLAQMIREWLKDE